MFVCPSRTSRAWKGFEIGRLHCIHAAVAVWRMKFNVLEGPGAKTGVLQTGSCKSAACWRVRMRVLALGVCLVVYMDGE